MTLNANEKRTVLAVFEGLLEQPYSEINRFIGSITIREMQVLYAKLDAEEYCDRHHVRFENMTDDDFENMALERAEQNGYAV